MALVQKLTGKSRSNVNDQSSKKSASNISASINYGSMTINNNIIKQEQDVCDDNDRSTSVVTIEENCRTGGVQGSVNQSNNLFFGELPLFTPNSTDFFSSPRPLNRYLDSPYGIMGSLISPAGLEFMKGLPEY
ncbi:VQ motif protein [Quillaja saponaria]|uniref:VQ motif protein n=1 Tax=Quillaja saponaria TaxID=32244 RepID=A0AAD7KNL8_QUISA|nr:VQ motif protein [Quillaja saponaria]